MVGLELFRVAAGADKQPEAMVVVMDQMEVTAPRCADERR